MDISTGHMVFTFSERYAEDDNDNGDVQGALIQGGFLNAPPPKKKVKVCKT